MKRAAEELGIEKSFVGFWICSSASTSCDGSCGKQNNLRASRFLCCDVTEMWLMLAGLNDLFDPELVAESFANIGNTLPKTNSSPHLLATFFGVFAGSWEWTQNISTLCENGHVNLTPFYGTWIATDYSVPFVYPKNYLPLNWMSLPQITIRLKELPLPSFSKALILCAPYVSPTYLKMENPKNCQLVVRRKLNLLEIAEIYIKTNGYQNHK